MRSAAWITLTGIGIGEQQGDRRPVITLRVRRYTWVRWAAPVAIVTVLLAGAAYQEWRLAPPQPQPASPASEPAEAARSSACGAMPSLSQKMALLSSIDGLGSIGMRR